MLFNSIVFLLIFALFLFASSLGSFLAGATENAKSMFIPAATIVVLIAIFGSWVWANKKEKGDDK